MPNRVFCGLVVFVVAVVVAAAIWLVKVSKHEEVLVTATAREVSPGEMFPEIFETADRINANAEDSCSVREDLRNAETESQRSTAAQKMREQLRQHTELAEEYTALVDAIPQEIADAIGFPTGVPPLSRLMEWICAPQTDPSIGPFQEPV